MKSEDRISYVHIPLLEDELEKYFSRFFWLPEDVREKSAIYWFILGECKAGRAPFIPEWIPRDDYMEAFYNLVENSWIKEQPNGRFICTTPLEFMKTETLRARNKRRKAHSEKGFSK